MNTVSPEDVGVSSQRLGQVNKAMQQLKTRSQASSAASKLASNLGMGAQAAGLSKRRRRLH